MVSRAKPTGTRRTTSTRKKPATIDLDAKEVNTSANTKTEAKPETTVKGKPLGRPGATQGASKTSTSTDSSAKTAAKSETDKTAAASKKEDVKKPGADKETAEKPAAKDPTPTSAGPAQTQPAAPAKSSGSFFGKLVTATMGGIAALAGFGAIGLWDGARELPIIGNFYGGSHTETISSAELEGLRAEIAAIRENSGDASAQLEPVTEKLSSLEAQMATLSQGTGGSDEISQKLSQLEQDLGTLNSSFADLTASAAEGSSTSPVALSAAIASLTQRLDRTQAELDTVAGSVSSNPTLDGLSQTVASLESQLQSVTGTLARIEETAAANSTSLQSLTEQSSTLENTVASVKASEKVARSVAVNALATALENDDALTLPIASIKALIGSTPETERLEALNTQGISTRKNLVESLDAFIATVRNPNAPPKEGSIVDRFWANAQNMVSFRASGPREGDDPLSILSRVKANVENDALVQAKSEWEKLPEEIRQQGTSWAEDLDTRLEAIALQDALNQKLTAEAG